MKIDELLDYFKENEVSIQLTLGINELPTVHALFVHNDKRELLKTEHKTLISALQLMKYRYEKMVKEEN